MGNQLVKFMLCLVAINALGQNSDITIHINSATDWQDYYQSGSNIEISDDGMVVPINQSEDYSFLSNMITFENPIYADEIIFKQSPVWDNWTSVSNVGPSGASNAPILVSVQNDEYYYLAIGSSGGYHAWESTDMINWIDHGPVTGNGELTGKWATSAEYKDGDFYIYYDAPNDQDPHLYIDNNLRDGIIGQDMGMAFSDPSNGSDCSVFRDDEDELFHIIYEDWSPINAQTHSWDSPLAGHTSSEDGFTGFLPHEHVPVIDYRTTPTGVFETHTHPYVDFDMSYEVHEPEQEAYGDYTTIKIGKQYYIFGDWHRTGGQSMTTARFTSTSLYQEFDLVGNLGTGHPDPTVGFAEGRFYLITQQNTDFVSPGPWVDGVSARVGVDTDGNGTIDNWTSWQSVSETYSHKPGFIRVVNVDDAKLNVSSLPMGYGFQFEFSIDNSVVANVSPLLDGISISFTDTPECRSNVALNKTATQSSTDHDGVASRAVDGNTNGIYANGSITHTLRNPGTTNPWWIVNLNGIYNLDEIVIYNRVDCCSERLAGAKVYVGNTNSTNPNDFTEIGVLTNADIQSFSNLEQDAAYVMIQIPGDNKILSLAEVEVYGCYNDTLSLTEHKISEILVYPNPSSDFIHILNLNSKQSYHLYNILGVSMKKGFVSNKDQIDIRDLSSGLYFLKFNNGNTIKIIKK